MTDLLPISIPGGDNDIRVVSAEAVEYYLKEQEEFAVPMAQVRFTTDGVEYLCSAQFTEQPQKIAAQEEVVLDAEAQIITTAYQILQISQE